MTRTRDLHLRLQNLTSRFSHRKATRYVVGGLALAGAAGVMVAAGLSGGPASTAGAQYAVNRAGRAEILHGSAPAAKRDAGRRGHGQQRGHSQLPARDQLTPVGVSGLQTSMAITPARYQNAKTIVRAAIDRHMGLRSAVIAVATAMQESTLLNLHYGDQDSVGLFQQRPSAGWGTARQIEQPGYAASAFLGALRKYQAQDPGWANQPLWETAQAVQRSALPSAYAKWEAQAAHLVATVTKRLS